MSRCRSTPGAILCIEFTSRSETMIEQDQRPQYATQNSRPADSPAKGVILASARCSNRRVVSRQRHAIVGAIKAFEMRPLLYGRLLNHQESHWPSAHRTIGSDYHVFLPVALAHRSHRGHCTAPVRVVGSGYYATDNGRSLCEPEGSQWAAAPCGFNFYAKPRQSSRVLERSSGSRAGKIAPASTAILRLDRRARFRAVRAEHATIA
jgi:hypothetical protein